MVSLLPGYFSAIYQPDIYLAIWHCPVTVDLYFVNWFTRTTRWRMYWL